MRRRPHVHLFPATLASARGLAAWLLPLLLVSCLEFEQQELHLRYDAAADRMDVMLIYRGLHAAEHNLPMNNGKSAMERALSGLEDVREHGAFAFRSSMNFSVDPVEEAEKDWVSKHIDVEHGGLFTDPKGRLCGYQLVRIRDFGAFVPRFAEEYQEMLFSLFGPAVDAENGWPESAQQALTRYIERGNAVITADGCCFEVRLPIREQDHGPVQRFVLGDPAAAPAASPPGRKPQHPAGAQRVTRAKAGVAASTPAKPNELTVRRDGDVTIVRYGTPGAAAMRVVIECGKGDNALHEELRQRGDAIEAGVPDQALLRRFAEFGERDAKLPPQLQELRR